MSGLGGKRTLADAQRHSSVREDNLNSGQLFRSSAAAAVIGGAGIVLLDVAQIVLEVPRRTVGLVEIPIILAVLFGLPGLYLHQAGRTGYLGLVVLVLTFAATALGIGHYYLVAFAEAVLGEQSPDAAAAVADAATVMAPFEFLAFVLGWLLLGVATFRAGMFPKIPAILIIVGIVLVLARAFFELPGPVGGVLMGFGIAWLGTHLFNTAGKIERRNEVAA